MNEERSARSWFDRLGQAFSGEPQDRDELVEVLRDAQRRGLVDADVLAIVEGALNVSDLQVRDIMIPRSQMVVVRADSPPEEFVKVVVESGHSRFPVVGDSRDQVEGILLAKDLLAYFASEGDRNLDLDDAMRPVVYIPESKRLNVLLSEFKANRNHMAIVVDEYGGVAGLVTIEDFNEYFDTAFSDEEFDTVGGLVIKAFGHLPKRGESMTIQSLDFRVLRADQRRVHLLRVTSGAKEPD